MEKKQLFHFIYIKKKNYFGSIKNYIIFVKQLKIIKMMTFSKHSKFSSWFSKKIGLGNSVY